MSYVIGIDLGTTNSTISFAQIDGDSPNISELFIPQWGPDQKNIKLFQLPSYLLFPPEGDPKWIVGDYAKKRGAELSPRLITSAKSWLSHALIDRKIPFLPLGFKECEGLEPMSPVEVSAEFLKILKKGWICSAPFEQQDLFITVPASFDPSSRNLVLEAAKLAGYPELVLIEEPLAAFYSWLEVFQTSWREILSIDDRILVIDIGGGTTDFTMIGLEEKEGELALIRESVGSHLLLGGDNIDLALGYYLKGKLEKEGHTINSWQLQSLCYEGRQAKEILLGNDSPTTVSITIHSKGSSLIGGTLNTTLSQNEIEELLISDFFPLIALSERTQEQKALAISKIGLPFAKDPRITAHLSTFIARGCGGKLPTKVLFNGGTMKSLPFQRRILELLNNWSKERSVESLPGANHDFAVSRGAAYYGYLKRKGGIRVRAGTSRSYYVGVEGAAPAVPGLPAPLHGVCIVPYGTEEGSSLSLEDETFSLMVGELVHFRFFHRETPTLRDGSIAKVGSVIDDVKDELIELDPIVTHLNQQKAEEKMILVKLHANVTEMGSLEFKCVADDGQEWTLSFDLRPSSV
ncbi:MAG: Hsp70 family protein [Chlamydiia bacterium]|nr:Hsp70 family protein [Chlamydiia bacterium]